MTPIFCMLLRLCALRSIYLHYYVVNT